MVLLESRFAFSSVSGGNDPGSETAGDGVERQSTHGRGQAGGWVEQMQNKCK